MSKMVVATFNTYLDAERAARSIKEKGLRTDDISIVTKQGKTTDQTDEVTGNDSMTMGTMKNDNVSDGILTGGVLGGLAGLLLGAGSMIIPGIGAIAAAGPITGLLSGAVTGGIVGGLVDLGIPEEEGRAYEEQIKRGKVLFSMKTENENVASVTTVLKTNAATSVDTY
jgi:uncharacterized membrane protein